MQLTKEFIPVMLTPFKANGSVDYDGLTRLTEFYLEAGAAGMFANCLSSEMFELDEAERLAVIKHVISVVNGKVPVVATGTFGGPIAQQAQFVNKVADCGTEAVIVITGLLANADESTEVFNARVAELFSLTGNAALGFYECPVPYKRLIEPQQLIDFVQTGRVIYHKDTCLDLDLVKAKLKAGQYNPKFGLYDAYMVHAVDSLKAGSKGLSCIQGNYFPELIVWLCQNYNNEALAEQVNLVQQFFINQMDVMHNVYPIVAKYFLQQRGFDMDLYTRRDVGSFTPAIKTQVEQLYTDYEALSSQISLEQVI